MGNQETILDLLERKGFGCCPDGSAFFAKQLEESLRYFILPEGYIFPLGIATSLIKESVFDGIVELPRIQLRSSAVICPMRNPTIIMPGEFVSIQTFSISDSRVIIDCIWGTFEISISNFIAALEEMSTANF